MSHIKLYQVYKTRAGKPPVYGKKWLGLAIEELVPAEAPEFAAKLLAEGAVNVASHESVWGEDLDLTGAAPWEASKETRCALSLSELGKSYAELAPANMAFMLNRFYAVTAVNSTDNLLSGFIIPLPDSQKEFLKSLIERDIPVQSTLA